MPRAQRRQGQSARRQISEETPTFGSVPLAQLHHTPPQISLGQNGGGAQRAANQARSPTTTINPSPATNKRPAPLWFALWNSRENRAYAIDVLPDELIPLRRELKNQQKQGGDRVAGPFHSRQKAENFAAAKLSAARAQRPSYTWPRTSFRFRLRSLLDLSRVRQRKPLSSLRPHLG